MLDMKDPEPARKSHLVPFDDDDRDLATRLIAARFRLPPDRARLICSLAGLGNDGATGAD
jgi:hypothetical protein